MKQHLGELLEKAIRQSEYPITKIAKRIGYTRQHMYNLFQQPQIDLLLLEEIGNIIHVDFSESVKSLKKYKLTHTAADVVNETNAYIVDGSYKDKYLALLEDYNKLLKEHSKLLKKK
jgi:hypothetical protein